MGRVQPHGRLVALDALRGVAAAVVLVHHVSMTVPAISAAYASSAGIEFGSVGWWATLSPLKILLAGPEFVLVFFVLSGFVLVRSPLAARPANGDGYDWVAYYPRRVIRLAVPVLVSIVLAAAWILLVPRGGEAEGGEWLARQGDPDLSIGNLLQEASIIGLTDRPDVNPPLWSLVWEMWFSLLLPVGVLLAAFMRRWAALWALLLITACSLGYLTSIEPLMYLPAFVLGALLAANYESLQRRSAALAASRWGTAVWVGISALGPFLLIAHWLFREVITGPWGDLTLSLRVPGAFLIVASVALWPPLQRPLRTRLLVWLGGVSFSLYLVHFPVVVAFADLLGPDRWWLAALASVPLSLVLAQLMTVWVERPSQRLGVRVGAAVSGLLHPSIRRRISSKTPKSGLETADSGKFSVERYSAPPHAQANETMNSTSTGESNGNTATPTADRA